MRIILLPARHALLLACALALAGCSPPETVSRRAPAYVDGYGPVQDGSITVPAVDPKYLEGVNRRTMLVYRGPERPGTIVVDPFAKFLYLVLPEAQAIRYPIAVGREGRGFRGSASVGRKEAWPGWAPTANMLRTEPEVYGPYARGIPGGVASPLGARALYLYRGSRDTHYRIHGTNDLSSIGNSTSAGCIRLFNQDAIDLFQRVPLGARVVVRSYAQSIAFEGVELANRGEQLPAVMIPPEVLYGAVAAQQAAEAEAQAGGT
jgi:lipoprotein-anchoring transpeptidase ErfK/SrfK